jgi:putative membrane protein (TIGR04086 family)
MALEDLSPSKSFSLNILSILIYTSLLVVPSYVAGWVSQHKGALLGFLVPFVACSVLVILAFSMRNPSLTATELIARWIEKATLPSIVGVVSGAAGQFHRVAYKKRQH